mgnify:CR=1 FL=1
MPYDSSLDVFLFSKVLEADVDRLTVSVYSYNNGPKKLQFKREVKNNEGIFRFAKLGRMTKKEIEGVMPFIQEAMSYMD